MMGHKQVLKGGGEYDVATRWRRVLAYCGRAGVCRRVKQKMSRRARHEARQELRSDPCQ